MISATPDPASTKGEAQLLKEILAIVLSPPHIPTSCLWGPFVPTLCQAEANWKET